jgi:amidohydrolase
MWDDLKREAERHYEEIVEFRHELHAHPELAYEEHETAARIGARLADIDGLTVRDGLAGGTGLVAVLDTGRPGPTVALRADIDALPITEQTGLPWASKNPGRMHACGHDGHAACVLGSAVVLGTLRDRLSGAVKFLFQPAEEGGAGAARMIEDGALADPDVDVIFALHSQPTRKVGDVATRPGPLLAATDGFQATIHGRGAHGAYPDTGVDPIVAAAHAVVALQSIVARKLNPLDAGVVTVGQIHAGTAGNVIPPAATLNGTIRSRRPEVRDLLHREVERVVSGTAAAHGCRAEVAIATGYPATVNDERATQIVADTAGEILGPEHFHGDEPPRMGGEDFAFYLQHVPGCFFRIGTCPRDRDEYPGHHTPDYDFSDGAVCTGMLMLSGLAIRCTRGALDRGPSHPAHEEEPSP